MARHRTRSRGKQRALGAAPAAPVRNQQTPLPGAIAGDHWEVKANGGPLHPAFAAVAGDRRVMSVPMGPEARERRTRLHEMGHVRWTRFEAKSEASQPSMNAAEDARIHKRLGELGFGDAFQTPLFGPEDLQRFRAGFHAAGQMRRGETPPNPMTWTPAEVGRILAGALRTAEWDPFAEFADESGFTDVRQYVETLDAEYMSKRRPAWKDTVGFAQGLDALDQWEGKKPGGSEGEKDDILRELQKQLDAEDDGSAPLWGEMNITRPPLRDRIPAGLRSFVRRATDTGAVPRNWHRMPSDGRVFSRRRRKPMGGTVLIDQSGSMALTADEVMQIIALYPGVTVAGYAGWDTGGELRILAEKGKRVSEDDCYMEWGGNTVDGPALEWLGSMPGPRVWVSDGHVVGIAGAPYGPLYADARRLVREHDITHVENVRDVIGYERGEE